MKKLFLYLFALIFMSCNTDQKSSQNPDTFGPITLVIHGGAGTIKKEALTAEREAKYHATLKEALDTGYAVLERGGSSIDAVIATIKILENSPMFNAGRGAVFNSEGRNELDASIMDGNTLKAGAVASVTTIKNPITAYAVMTNSQHVMLAGAGAEKFAQDQGLEIVDPSYFFDSLRYQQLLKLQREEGGERVGLSEDLTQDQKFGTVGCVALDQYGNIAAGTSTGGMTNKKYGRVGDAPIIGAGTYANNLTCGVSSTGHGEYFIRLAVAHEISAQMEHRGLSLEEASTNVIFEKLGALGGTGGLVALDRQGNISTPFNTSGMYRGYRKKGEEARTFIFKE